MRVLLSMVLTAGLILLAGQPALADKRVALVIGNSAYRNVAKLTNPANDAAAIAAMFKSARFDIVESRLDLTVSELRKTLRDFGNKSRDADVAVIYYAGHGIELDGANYLIPVDATLETDTDVLDETLSLDRVLVAVEPARQLRLVILDACRDNPFAKSMKRTIASRAIGRGLAKVEPSSPNTMVAFAAKAGSTASDGDSKNSPFAAALVNHLPKPGLDLRKAFGFVRDDVLKATNNTQEPFVYGSLGGNDVALVPAAPAPQAADQDAAMQRNYELALQIGTKPVWDAFIEKYPTGFFTALAKAQRDKLAAEAARIEATGKAKAAEEDKVRLASEGAKATEQARAAEQAKAAEKIRLAAEQAKKAEDAKVAEAERAKAAAEAKAVADKKANDERLAALTPPADPSDQPKATDLPRALQAELRRVGCNTGAVDGNWNAASQRSLDLFNKHAGIKLEIKTASLDALDVVKSKTMRVCPLSCERGYKADGEQCTKITCPAGATLDDDGNCERSRAKSVTRSPTDSDPTDRAKPSPQDSASGNALKESMKIMGPGAIRTGQTMTLTTPSGRKMTCTGGDRQQNVPRSCFWN
jgi:uncharacterized caspase-like protein